MTRKDDERKRNDAKRAREYRRREKAKRVLGLGEDDTTPADEVIASRQIVAGNKLRLTHGARDPERVGPLAEQVMAALLNSPTCRGDLKKPEMYWAVAAWAQAEAQVHLMRVWLDSEGITAAFTELTTTSETETGIGEGTVHRQSASRKVASLMSELHKAEVRANNCRIQLGLTPLALMRLGKDATSAQWDLARMFGEFADQDEKRARKAKDGDGDDPPGDSAGSLVPRPPTPPAAPAGAARSATPDGGGETVMPSWQPARLTHGAREEDTIQVDLSIPVPGSNVVKAVISQDLDYRRQRNVADGEG